MGGDPKLEARSQKPEYVLGIEGGGTRTTALLADRRGRILNRLELGPLNLKLSSDALILATLRRIRSSCISHSPSAVSLCLSGCRTPADRERLRSLAHSAWPKAQNIFAGNDLDSGFAASFGVGGTGILVISGTGSCVYGRNGTESARAGGWG